jgi:hypothetical protein
MELEQTAGPTNADHDFLKSDVIDDYTIKLVLLPGRTVSYRRHAGYQYGLTHCLPENGTIDEGQYGRHAPSSRPPTSDVTVKTAKWAIIGILVNPIWTGYTSD